jgi:hypothetical protein
VHTSTAKPDGSGTVLLFKALQISSSSRATCANTTFNLLRIYAVATNRFVRRSE